MIAPDAREAACRADGQSAAKVKPNLRQLDSPVAKQYEYRIQEMMSRDEVMRTHVQPVSLHTRLSAVPSSPRL